MRIGIVKEKYNKKTRWLFYILIPLFLLVTYPLLIEFGFEKLIAAITFGFITIVSFILLDKKVEDIEIVGELEINSDSFLVIQNDQEILIPFKNIRLFLLNPTIGLSRVAETYKVYDCQIKTIEKNYHLKLTRCEIKNGKVVSRNLVNPKAFDLIKFLKKQNINLRIEIRKINITSTCIKPI